MARSKSEKLGDIEREVVECRRCPRLVAWREQVAREKVRRFRAETYWGRPVPAFGDPEAGLFVVGLAPAAHGGNRTGRIFTGDRSGDWLYEALHRFGFANQPTSLHRDDGLELDGCLVAAAARCAPPDNRPLPSELDNCRPYLVRELQIVRPRVVVGLGRIAVAAFLRAWREVGFAPPDRGPDFAHGAEWRLPGGVTLIASYHPSQQNTQTGKLTRPMFHRIFRRARNLLDAG